MSWGTASDYETDVPRMPYADAVKIMRFHGIPWDEFAVEFGDCSQYATDDVLAWLGY